MDGSGERVGAGECVAGSGRVCGWEWGSVQMVVGECVTGSGGVCRWECGCVAGSGEFMAGSGEVQ